MEGGSQRARLGVVLESIHTEVQAGVLAGDPTPFKRFRRQEYLCTAARFDPTMLPVEQALAQRITLNGELCQVILRLQAQGVLTFGLSDKPDGAACPSEAQSRQGRQPLHRLETLVVRETRED